MEVAMRPERKSLGAKKKMCTANMAGGKWGWLERKGSTM